MAAFQLGITIAYAIAIFMLIIGLLMLVFSLWDW